MPTLHFFPRLFSFTRNREGCSPRRKALEPASRSPKNVLSCRLGEAQAAWKLTGSQRPTDAPNTRHSLPRSAAERRRIGALLACPRPCHLVRCSACHPQDAPATQLNLDSWLPGCHPAGPRSHRPATCAHSCPLQATVLHGRPRWPLPQQEWKPHS